MNRQEAKIAKLAEMEPSHKADALAPAVIGAAIEVHRHLGPGYLESVYEEAMSVELSLRDISFERQHPIGVQYKGEPIGQARVDLLVGGSLIVELKAVDALLPIHTAQVISYLKATRCGLGLLVKFNVPALRAEIHRVVLS